MKQKRLFEQLVSEMSGEFGIPYYKMRALLTSFKDRLIEAVDNGDEFILSGLFAVKQRMTKQYNRINPFTKQHLVIPARFQTKMIPAKKIKYHPISVE